MIRQTILGFFSLILLSGTEKAFSVSAPQAFECSVQNRVIFSIGRSPGNFSLNNGESIFWMASELNSLFPQQISFGPIIESRSSRTPSGPDRLGSYRSPLLIKGVVRNYRLANTSEIFIKAKIDFNTESVELLYNPVYVSEPEHQGYRYFTRCDRFRLKW